MFFNRVNEKCQVILLIWRFKMKRVAILLTAVLVVLMNGTFLLAQETTKSRAVTYKTVGDKELKIHLHFPPDWKTRDRRPAIIFFFGGGWTGGTPG